MNSSGHLHWSHGKVVCWMPVGMLSDKGDLEASLSNGLAQETVQGKQHKLMPTSQVLIG